MEKLRKNFNNTQEMIIYLRGLVPWAEGEASLTCGDRQSAENILLKIDPISYSYTRNYGDGKITRLSPYIHHGILSLNEVRNYALTKCKEPAQIQKFIQELSWRDFWSRTAASHPEWIWNDVEPYKTGFMTSDYSDLLPDDIKLGKTGIACLDAFINELINTGYIHNHARMYLASYVVHFRHIKWQAGAKWFLHNLLDGDLPSNNLSWQWVASTFSHKPYIFNLENVDKYFGKVVDTSPKNNQPLHATYEELNEKLFPNIKVHK